MRTVRICSDSHQSVLAGGQTMQLTAGRLRPSSLPLAARPARYRMVTADDAARVIRERDDEIEDYVLGEKIEEVVAVHESGKTLLDDPKEWMQSTEVRHVSWFSTRSVNN